MLDANNNPVSGASVTLTLSNGTATPTGVLAGTVTQKTDASGNATFNDLSVNKAGTGYTLTAASGALTSAASAPFTVTAATAAQISFIQQPADTVSGQAVSPAVVVQLLDANNNPVPNASVTLTLTGGSGTLSGTASQITDAGGNATFSNLSIDKTGAENPHGQQQRLAAGDERRLHHHAERRHPDRFQEPAQQHALRPGDLARRRGPTAGRQQQPGARHQRHREPDERHGRL